MTTRDEADARTLPLRHGELPTEAELAQVRRLIEAELHNGDWRWSLWADPGGTWLCIDFIARLVIPPREVDEPGASTWTTHPKFALWRNTGAVYRVGEDGAVEDDPILEAVQ